MQKIKLAFQQYSMNQNLMATLAVLVFLFSLLTLIKVFGFANVGVDLTDEGYYLNWISQPWLYKYYVSQFGYFYHPIYQTLNENIVYLRQANMVTSYFLSWALAFFILRDVLEKSSFVYVLLVSAGLALPALFILMITGRWVATPSYNSLNFQGCLVATLGLYFTCTAECNRQILASVLIGIGGWLVFLAKPSSALLLAGAAVLFYVLSIKRDWRVLAGAGAVSTLLLACTALYIDGSIVQYIKRYQGGFLLLSTLSDGYGLGNLFKLDFFSLPALFKLKFLSLTLLLVALLYLIQHKQHFIQNIVLILLATLIGYSFIYSYQTHISDHQVSKYHTLMILAVSVASVLNWLLTQKNKQLNLNQRRFLLLCIVMPYIFAAGSGNNYWQTAAGAGFFWVLVAVLMLDKSKASEKSVLIIVAFVITFATTSMIKALDTPYRQSQSIFEQSATYANPYTNQTMLLSGDTAKYLNTLKKVVTKAGFKQNTPVLDLTGHHPGTLYFMQAKAIGQAWMSGGYAGSEHHAVMALNKADCVDIANAWLLIEPDGKRQISLKILSEHGLNDSINKYQVMAKFKTQMLQDFGSVNEQHPDGRYFHYLLKPIDVESQINSCLAYRKSHPSPFDALD